MNLCPERLVRVHLRCLRVGWIAWVAASGSPAWAQAEPPEPSEIAIDVARRAVREEQTRLRLSSPTPGRCGDDERTALRTERWCGVVGLTPMGAGWGAGAAVHAIEDGRATHRWLLGGASAISLGLGAATLFAASDDTASTIARWGALAEGAMIGTSALILAANGGCGGDCSLMLFGGRHLALAAERRGRIGVVIYPFRILSEEFPRDAAMAGDARTSYGLDARARGAHRSERRG